MPDRALGAGEEVRMSLTGAVQSGGGAALAAQVFQFTAGVSGGSGLFGGSGETTVGSNPGGVAVGDLDGDGDLDLVAANTGPYQTPGTTVSVRLNTGAGTFVAPATGAELTVGNNPQRVALGDVDNDGDLDLLVANMGSNTVSLRLNTGSGTFTTPTSGAEISINKAADVTLADLDGDGDLDLLVLNGLYTIVANGGVSVRLNDGNGHFSVPAANAEVEAGNGPYKVLTGDLDNDGDLDLLVANDGASFGFGNVSLHFNNGQGGLLTLPTNATVPLGPGVDDAALGDVDGDGDLDLLAVNFGGPTSVGTTVSLRLNNGSGVFAAPATGAEISVGRGPRSLALGDVDHDGDLDLLVGNRGLGSVGTTVSVRLNTGLHTGVFAAPTLGAEVPVGNGPEGTTLADLDGDGDLDLLTANADGSTVSVRLNAAAALATAAPLLPARLTCHPNPAREVAQLAVPVGTTEVVLLTALGQQLRRVPVAPATTEVSLPLAGLPAGLYLLQAGPAVARLAVE